MEDLDNEVGHHVDAEYNALCIGNGHPDPDIGFAESRFYLITQQGIDYVSPGPWVEEVEARVGVDTDGDGKLDKWTDWSEVQES